MEQPADLSKLMDKLAGAKKIMAHEDATNPVTNTKQSVSEGMLGKEKEMPTLEQRIQARKTAATTSTPSKTSVSPESIKNSKLPKEIMESLLHNPIEVNADPMAGKMDDFARQLDEMAGITHQVQPQVMNESIQPATGLTEAQVREIIKEELMSFFGETMVKNVTEQVLSKFRRKKKS